MGGDSSGGRQDRGKGEVRAEDRGERRAGRAEEGKGSFGGGSSGRWLLMPPMEWVAAARPAIRGSPPHLTDR